MKAAANALFWITIALVLSAAFISVVRVGERRQIQNCEQRGGKHVAASGAETAHCLITIESRPKT